MSTKVIEQKQKLVEDIYDKVQRAKSIVLLNYCGISVKDDTSMRNELRKENIEYKVLKNSLVLRALEKAEILDEEMKKALTGPTAVAFSFDDATAPARILAENAKKIPKISIKGGIVEGKVLNAKEINAVASIPSKNVLLAQLLGLLTSPMRSLAIAVSEVAKKNQQ